jgi:hypothetical protein
MPRRLRIRFRGFTTTGAVGAYSLTGQSAALGVQGGVINASFTLAASNLDATTLAAYSAAITTAERAAIVVAALTGTVVCEIVDAVGVVRASGTMASPWATASGSTVTVGEVTGQGIDVLAGGAPDANWYCQFRSGTRFVRGTFGVLGSGRDFVWSLASFSTGSRGTLGAVVLSSTGVADVLPPANTVLPSITGTLQVGQPLTVSTGSWTNQPSTFSVQWQRATTSGGSYSNISGATALSYTLLSGDLAYFLRATVTASNVAGSATATSAAAGPVVAAPSGAPTLTTAGTIEVYRATASETTYQIVAPGVWVNDMPTFASPGYAIQRRFQWQADGVDIANAIGTVYSPGRAQAGKSIRCKETVWFLSAPSVTSVSFTNSITAPAIGSYAADIVYHDDIEWLGAFKFPNTGRATPFNFFFGGRGVGYDASGAPGAGSLFVMGHAQGKFAGELSIPTVSPSAVTFSSLPTATLLASSDDIFNGRSLTAGINSGNGATVAGILPDGAGKLVFTLHNDYPATPSLAYMFRRPRDLTSGSEIEGPFRVTDPTRDAPRTGSGYLSAIPSALHVSLGGTHLHGLIPNSGGAYPGSSTGPSLNSFNLSDLNTATERAFKFDVVSATANTVELPSPASTTAGFYVGGYVQLIPTGSGPSVPIRITAYNGGTRTATLASNWPATPSGGAKAQLVAQVESKALANYDVSPFGNNVPGWNVLNRIWDPSVNIYGAFVPNGTRSALVWGDHGAGIYQYTNNDSGWQGQAGTLTISNVVAVSAERWTCTISGISGSLASNHVIVQGSNIFYQVGNSGGTYTLNVFRGDSYQGQFGTPGVVPGAGGAPVSGSALFTLNYTWPFFAYDPAGTSTGEHSYPYHLKLWTYNTDDLAAVKDGSLPLQSIRPTQMYQFKLPVGNNPDIGRLRGAAYDPATRRVYVSVGFASGSGDEPAIHVFRINSAVVP